VLSVSSPTHSDKAEWPCVVERSVWARKATVTSRQTNGRPRWRTDGFIQIDTLWGVKNNHDGRLTAARSSTISTPLIFRSLAHSPALLLEPDAARSFHADRSSLYEHDGPTGTTCKPAAWRCAVGRNGLAARPADASQRQLCPGAGIKAPTAIIKRPTTNPSEWSGVGLRGQFNPTGRWRLGSHS